MIQGLKFGCALVGFHDFGSTGTEDHLILIDLFPCNWAARAAHEKNREREKFEQFKRSALFSRNIELTTLVGVTEGCELVVF